MLKKFNPKYIVDFFSQKLYIFIKICNIMDKKGQIRGNPRNMGWG